MVLKDNSSSQPNGFAMTGGNGEHSYTKNSAYQRKITDATKSLIQESISEKFEPPINLQTLCIADLGCSVGPNTFISVENILQSIKLKYLNINNNTALEDDQLLIPEFQVHFNDHSSNDFNTLFNSLPPNRDYYASGVPGSFYTRLFPHSSLHIVHSSYSIHWLSRVPKEVMDKNSVAWNKGRVHLAGAGEEVVEAYAKQHAMDLSRFVRARARELVHGGLVMLAIPARSNGTPHSRVSYNILHKMLGDCLMDLVTKGRIEEEKVDSFNIPAYHPCPQELEEVIEQSGCFSIERMESLPQVLEDRDDWPSPKEMSLGMRAILQELLKEQFGHDILDEVFSLFTEKLAEARDGKNTIGIGSQMSLFVLLKLKQDAAIN